MLSYCRFKPIEYSYSESVSVSVPKHKIRGWAIYDDMKSRAEICYTHQKPTFEFPTLSNEILRDVWALCLGLKRAWKEFWAGPVLSHEINESLQTS